MSLEVLQLPPSVGSHQPGKTDLIHPDEVLCLPDFGTEPARVIFIKLTMQGMGEIYQALANGLGLKDRLLIVDKALFEEKIANPANLRGNINVNEIYPDKRVNADGQRRMIFVKNLGDMGIKGQ